MSRLFAIGDIHGEVSKLRTLLHKLSPTADDDFIFLGDYIDRGENSKETIDTLIELDGLCTCTFLTGNHELMMKRAHRSRADQNLWLNNGGVKTILDYGSMDRIMPTHGDFFNNLASMHETEDYYFVHAGFEPGVPIQRQNIDTMVWIRDEFLDHPTRLDKVVIHGHNPIDDVVLDGDKINLDTGAVYGDKLTALQLPEKTLIQV